MSSECTAVTSENEKKVNSLVSGFDEIVIKEREDGDPTTFPSPPSQVRPSYSFSPRLSRPPFQPRDDEIKVGLRQSIISAQPQTLPSLGKNEVKIKIATIGLSYYDFKRRIWNYTLKGTPPYIAGYQGGGVVVESKCTNIAVGTKLHLQTFLLVMLIL